MSPRRFLSVIVSLALSLQVVLAGGGALCVGPSQDGLAAMVNEGEGMAGMSMELAKAPGTATVADSARASEGGSGTVPCDRAPTSQQCQLFASCASGFTVTPVVEMPVLERPHPSVRLVDLPTLTSRTIAPELPPPRA